ncbi:MAG TPA: hypothetical protein VLW54_09880 [Candidatus Acidoferrales bacterium]|nr:hypothetical protein [Candidatus Acidoferrales bacterium]
MPVVGSSGYGTASGVLSLVRSLLDDAAVSTGDVFTDSVLIPFVNSAYHQVQFEMANSGIETFVKDNVVLTVPAVTGVDPSIQVVCNDTQNQMTTVAPTPQLPTDMLVPVRLWERQTGSSEPFLPMYQRKDGLPSETQQERLRYWEWRTDGIIFLGATQSNDIRLRYESVLPDVAQGSDTLQLRGAQDAIAFYAAALAAQSRGSPFAGQLASAGDQALRKILVRGTRRQQHSMHRRRPYGWRSQNVFL